MPGRPQLSNGMSMCLLVGCDSPCWNPCTQEVETGGPVTGHPGLLGELGASLGYMRSCPPVYLSPMIVYCLQSSIENTAHMCFTGSHNHMPMVMSESVFQDGSILDPSGLPAPLLCPG